jgi:exodeoxyribonuclease V gamma subunit
MTNNINLFFSHEVEQLAGQLAENVLHEIRGTSNPLQPSHVIVPNANMQRYLQLFMAEQQGICANLEFPFLEKGLSQYLNLFESTQQAPLWSQAELSIKIYAFLSSADLMADAAIQPINKYLNNQSNELLLSRKKWQLAQRLAVLFVSYELQRPEMVMQWVTGKSHFYGSEDQQLKAIETAERHIYQSIMQSNQQLGGHSLFQRFQLIDWQQVNKSDQAMHLFTPTRLSAFHRHLLAHLAQFLSVNIYQLNVCCEYWEDLTTDQEDAWQQRINSQPIAVQNDQGQAISAADTTGQQVFISLSDEGTENPLLKAWAKPGRESLRLFSELEDEAIHLNVAYQPDWLFSHSNRNQKALHVIQDSILTRTQQKNQFNSLEQLSTLQMAVAPSIYREVQAVYNSVLLNLQQDDALQLTDIAILVPDMNKYRCVIEQVFAEQSSQHPFHLRYSLIDSSVKTESLYAQAVLGMFDVLEHDFVRAVVLKWLANDCVKQALNLSDEELAEWLDWLSRLGVYSHYDHLYDAPDEAELSRRFTWQQGLQRLRQSLVSDEVMLLSQDSHLMGRLSWVIENLHQWHQTLQKPRYPKDWQQLLSQLINNFIAIPEGQNKEDQVRLALSESIDKLVQHADQVLMSLADVRHFIEQQFIHLSASKGNYLSGGLVCASLQPMRPIPFKITYILGLDERSFPGELLQETLDLTQRSRRLGDINKIENMNYLFLETLMCSREKLYLSYVGHDLVKDESILPSSTWQQLHAYATSLMDQTALGLTAYPVTRIALDSANFSQTETDCLSMDWLVNFSPGDHQKYAARYEQLTTGLSKDNTQVVNQILSTDSQDADSSVNVSVQALAKFIENPVLSYLDQVGASSQLIEDQLNIEHEPFSLDGLSRHQLFDSAVSDYLEALNQQQPISLSDAIDEQYGHMSKQSQLPIHLFAELDKLYELDQHDSFKDLQTELKSLQPLSGPVVFGDGYNQTTPSQRLTAMSVVTSDHLFEINGSWEGLYTKDGQITHQVVVSSSSGKSNAWSKHLIKPFVYWCLAQLDEQVNIAEYFQLRVVFRDQVNSYTLKPWSTGEHSFTSKSQIKDYLAKLLVAFNQPSLVNLPFDAVSSLKVGVDGRDQVIPYLGPKSTAKSIHVFAYEPTELSDYEMAQIQKCYEEKATSWIESHSYYEMLQALALQFDAHALSTYRQRLLPLHVMAAGQLP